MGKSKVYKIIWETYKNNNHVFHVQPMMGENAKAVRQAFERDYGYIKGKVPYPYHLSIKPWKDHIIPCMPSNNTKVTVWSEQGYCMNAFYDDGTFYTYGFTKIPKSIITKWKVRY